MKRIIIDVESDEENSRIENHVKRWAIENLKSGKDSKIEVVEL